MKITRYKKVQKYLKFYYNNFGFHQPYQVLVDGTFCFAAFKTFLVLGEDLVLITARLPLQPSFCRLQSMKYLLGVFMLDKIMDSKCRRIGRLIDIVDEEWRAEQLPHEDIQVPLEELPDPESDSVDSHLTLKEQSMRWQENFPEPEQINIREQIPKYLNSQAKLLTTRCIIIETEKISKKTHGALTILKQYGIHECGHKEPVSGSKCIWSMIGKSNDKHYILATQDRDLQDKMREKAGVPLLYLHNKSPTLEKPSKASNEKAGQCIETNQHMFISENQNEALKNMKKAFGVVENVEELKVPIKKKKPHNPNPLSCKKKKRKPGKEVKKDKVVEGRVRKRKKKNLPEHMKEQMKSAMNE